MLWGKNKSFFKCFERALVYVVKKGMKRWPLQGDSLTSRTQCKYFLKSTSRLTGLFGISLLLHFSRSYVCFGELLLVRALCDAFRKGGHLKKGMRLISIQSWTYLGRFGRFGHVMATWQYC